MTVIPDWMQGQVKISLKSTAAVNATLIPESRGRLEVFWAHAKPSEYSDFTYAMLAATKHGEIVCVWDQRKQKWVSIGHRSINACREWEKPNQDLLCLSEDPGDKLLLERIDRAFARSVELGCRKIERA